MKQTGSLLKETIEIEALCAKNLDNAEHEAELIIQAAEKDAEKISAESTEQIIRYKKNADLSIENKKETIREEFETKGNTSLRLMQEKFSTIAGLLAEETAERIIRYDR